MELSPENGGEVVRCVLRDAITAARLEKLGGEQYRYDFESALDYPLDSYTMSFADLVATENQDAEGGSIVFSPEDGEW